MTAAWLKGVPGGVELLILVQPRASRTQVVGEHDGRLKIALAAPPVDGEANEALIAFLAGVLKAKKRDICLIDGSSSRRKRLSVQGVAATEVMVMMPVP